MSILRSEKGLGLSVLASIIDTCASFVPVLGSGSAVCLRIYVTQHNMQAKNGLIADKLDRHSVPRPPGT